MVKGNLTRNLIIKVWKRCSFLQIYQSSSNRKKTKSLTLAPHGCFSVYVGPEKQRFAVKAECANHPLFKALLEDAALEYGFSSGGPILLPCEVDLFDDVLAEIESDVYEDVMISAPNKLALIPCSSPARQRCSNARMNISYGCAYRLLIPSSLLRLNQF